MNDIPYLADRLAPTHIAHNPLRWLPDAFNKTALACTDDTNTRDLAYIAALDALHRRHKKTKSNSPGSLSRPACPSNPSCWPFGSGSIPRQRTTRAGRAAPIV